ncbi:MAG TPA: hypothetical protein PLD84_09850, partial [Chitinophagales bacterium]|nr:hypothetical protein [Chitinophagales bacterium]
IPYSIPANVVAQGSFPINATVTLPNSGIILPAGGAFTANTTHYVWIIAKGTIEKNHIPSPLVYLPVTAGPFGGPPALTQGTAGPTFTFTSPAAGNNASGPGGPFSSPNVVSNNVVASFCSNSYQVLNTPIVFYEGTSLGQQFFGAGTQTVNLCLPAGFTFDVSTTAGIPNFGKVLLQGSDFPFGANSGSLTYLSPTVVRISFVNTGNVSRDQIIISNLRVISSGATTGRIFRLGGSGLPTITDLTNVASLRAIDAPVQNFDNSYSLSLLPPPTSVETAIPDNYVTPNALVTLFPIVPASQSYDTGPSTFSGQGITGNNLNLNGVTLDAPFNITINHTDQNGCISNNAVQYVVYDHNVGIKITDVNAPAQPTNNGPYCAINPQFQINNTLPASGAGVTRYIRFDNLTVYNLVSLKAEIPVTSTGLKVPPGPPYINPQDYSGDWTTAIKTTPTPVPPGASLPLTGLVKRGASTVVVGNTYYDYSFSDLPIVNANVASTIPYIYEMGAGTTAPFKRNTNPNQNYRTTPAGPPVAATFYTGGSLGFVELTGNFKNVSNPAVSINRRQTIEFFAPPVPIVEVASPYSFLDTGDANNLPGSGPSTPGINNPGTMVYCQAEGDINFNGWPSATAGVSKGTFTLLKAPFNPYSLASIIYDADPRDAAGVSLGAPVTPPGFTDNGNGTSKLTPTLINNGFADIMVRYTFNENGSPCTSFGYQMIRITPNPVANLTWSTFPLTPNAPSASSQCAGQQIQFVSSAFIPPGDASASVNQWAWDFGDVTGTNNLIPMNTTTQTVVHTFNNPSGQGSHYQITHNALSNYGCKSLPTVVSTSPANYVQNLDIGGIPTVKFKLEGVSTADLFGFNSNSTSVKFSTIPGSNLPADNTTISANDIIVNYDWDFGDGTPHTLVSNLTPGYSVSAPGSPGSGVVNSPAGTPNAITAPVNASNINLYNANIATHTYAVTGKQSANLTVTTLLGCVNSLALQNSYRDIVVLPRKVLPAAIPPSTPAGVYVEDFESVATANDWNAWGTGTSAAAISAGVALKSWNLIPSVGTLPPPPSGTKYWKTHNGSGQYNPLEKSALYSPSMDISNLTRPMISFNTLVQTNISDGVVLEFSTDDLNIADPNKKWQSLGTLTDGQDWYNAQGIAGRPGTQAANDYGWSGYINDPIATSTPLWLSSKHTLDAVYPPINVGGNPAKTVFRFALGVAANNAVNVGPGFVLDNVRIGDRTRTMLLESCMNSSNTNAAEKVQNEFINNY